MNFALSDEQEFLKEAARGALARVHDRRGGARGARRRAAARPVADRRARRAGRACSVAEERGGAGLGAARRDARVRGARPRAGGRAAARPPARDARARPRRAPTPACWRRWPSGERARRVRPRAAADDLAEAGRPSRGSGPPAAPRRRCSRTATVTRRRSPWVPDAPGADVLVVVAAADGARRARCAATPDAAVEAGRALRRDALARPRAPATHAPATRARRRRGHAARAAWHLAQALLGAESLGAVERRAGGVRRSTPRSASRSGARSAPTRPSSTSSSRSCAGSRTPARSCTTPAGPAQDTPDEFAARRVGVPARGGQGGRPRHAHADLRPRRHRRDVGARRAAVLPPRAAVAAPARRGRGGGRHGWRASCSPRHDATRPPRPERRGRRRPSSSSPAHARLDAPPLALPAAAAPPLPARQVRAACASAWWPTASSRPDEVHEPEPVPWSDAGARARRRPCSRASARGELTRARAARARAAVVARARRARRGARRPAPSLAAAARAARTAWR